MKPLAGGGLDGVALAVLVLLFVVVTVLGFMATRFKRGDHLESLDEWGLGGRKFGTWITWFLLGGDLTLTQQIAQTFLLIGLFVPFSHFMDTMVWRSHQRRLAKQANAKKS